MPVQLIRRVRSRQPSTSVKVDFENPITKGLSGLIRLDARAEVVKGKLYTATGTKLQRSSVGTGRGFGSTDGAGTTDKVLTDIVGTQGPRTYFVLAKLNGWGGGNLGRFFDGTTSSKELFYINNAAGNGGLIYWRQFSGGPRTALTVDPNSVSNQFGKITSYSVSFDSSSPSNQAELYIAGTRYAFASLDSVPTGTANSTGAFYIGNRGTDNLRNIDGTIYLVLVFDRMLSASEHKSLTENPWQVFAPEPIPLFWSGAAVGRTATASLSAAIRSGQSMTASASAVISVANTATVSASAAIRADHSATASVSAAIRSDRTASASLNAAIQSAATASATLSGAIQTAQSATSGLAAYIVASSARSESAVLSAAISDARTATSSLSAAVAAARTATATLDSAVQIEVTASTGVSAAIREAFSISANLSGAVQSSATASASLAAVVAKTNALSSGLSAAVRAEQTAFAALSAYIAADVVLTQAEIDMLCDIWQRFGLDPLAPLTETETASSFGGIVLSKYGTNTITSTRAGDSAAGIASSMILDVWQRLGLDPDNPMTASETQISAGTLSQARAVSGATVTVTRAP